MVSPDGIHVILTERDTSDAAVNGGAIVGEQYTAHASLPEIVDRAKKVGDKYGKVWICKLEFVGSLEECEAIIEKEMPF